MDRNRIARMCAVGPLVLIVLTHLPVAATAQEVTEDYILYHLGPAAEEMQWAGVDGSAASSPAMIEIGQRWGIEPAYWVSADEARMLVRADNEDRDARDRQASMLNPLDRYPFRITLARFGVMAVGGLTCAEAEQKARSAQRLAESLSRVSQLNGVGTGLIGAISQGAARFVAPMAFATLVTAFASTWANQLAAGYRYASCVTGGQVWRFRPNVLKTSLSPDPSRVPSSSPGRRGSAFAASRTGPTFRLPGLEHRSRYRLASGLSRSL